MRRLTLLPLELNAGYFSTRIAVAVSFNVAHSASLTSMPCATRFLYVLNSDSDAWHVFGSHLTSVRYRNPRTESSMVILWICSSDVRGKSDKNSSGANATTVKHIQGALRVKSRCPNVQYTRYRSRPVSQARCTLASGYDSCWAQFSTSSYRPIFSIA